MSLHSSQKGQGLIEYILIFILVAIVVMVIAKLFGPAIQNYIDELLSAVNS